MMQTNAAIRVMIYHSGGKTNKLIASRTPGNGLGTMGGTPVRAKGLGEPCFTSQPLLPRSKSWDNTQRTIHIGHDPTLNAG